MTRLMLGLMWWVHWKGKFSIDSPLYSRYTFNICVSEFNLQSKWCSLLNGCCAAWATTGWLGLNGTLSRWRLHARWCRCTTQISPMNGWEKNIKINIFCIIQLLSQIMQLFMQERKLGTRIVTKANEWHTPLESSVSDMTWYEY